MSHGVVELPGEHRAVHVLAGQGWHHRSRGRVSSPARSPAGRARPRPIRGTRAWPAPPWGICPRAPAPSRRAAPPARAGPGCGRSPAPTRHRLVDGAGARAARAHSRRTARAPPAPARVRARARSARASLVPGGRSSTAPTPARTPAPACARRSPSRRACRAPPEAGRGPEVGVLPTRLGVPQ